MPSCLWPQRGTTVNGSQHGDNPLLKPIGIQIATKNLARSSHSRISGIFRHQDDVFGYELQLLLSEVYPVFQNLNYKLQRSLSERAVHVLPKSSKMIPNVFLAIEGLHEDKSCEEENRPWSEIRLPSRMLPMCAFHSRVQGFSTLARGRSSCPLSSPKLTPPIEHTTVRLPVLRRLTRLSVTVPPAYHVPPPPEWHRIGARKRRTV